MTRMPTRDQGLPKTRAAWIELSRGAGTRLGILMRQVKIKPEHIGAQARRKAS